MKEYFGYQEVALDFLSPHGYPHIILLLLAELLTSQ